MRCLLNHIQYKISPVQLGHQLMSKKQKKSLQITLQVKPQLMNQMMLNCLIPHYTISLCKGEKPKRRLILHPFPMEVRWIQQKDHLQLNPISIQILNSTIWHKKSIPFLQTNLTKSMGLIFSQNKDNQLSKGCKGSWTWVETQDEQSQ